MSEPTPRTEIDYTGQRCGRCGETVGQASAAVKALMKVSADRDEWRTQHENLLSVKRSDNAALTERIANLERTLAAANERAEQAERQLEESQAERERLTKELASERTARKEADEHAIDLRNEIVRLDAALAAPPSPLLPGLEPVAWMWLHGGEMMNGTEVEQYEEVEFSLTKPEREEYGLTPLYTAAEISRLKGEGSDHE